MKDIIEYINESLDNINCLCLLKPGFIKYKDEFEKLLQSKGWKIKKQLVKKFSKDEIEEFYKMHKDKPFYYDLCNYMCSDDCCCYACYKNTDDPIEEMNKFKDNFRKQYGESDMKNGMHSSDSLNNVKREYKIIFK